MSSGLLDRLLLPWPGLQRRWLLNWPLLWRSGLLSLPVPMLALAAVGALWAQIDPPTFEVLLSEQWTLVDTGLWWVTVAAWALWQIRWRAGLTLGEQSVVRHLAAAGLGGASLAVMCLPMLVYAGMISLQVAAALPPEVDAAVRTLLRDRPCVALEGERTPDADAALRALQRLDSPVQVALSMHELQCPGAILIKFLDAANKTLNPVALRRGLDRIARERERSVHPSVRAAKAAVVAGAEHIGLWFFAVALLFAHDVLRPRLRGRFDALRLPVWPRSRVPDRLAPMRRLLLAYPAVWAARPLTSLLGGLLVAQASLWMLTTKGLTCPSRGGLLDFSELALAMVLGAFGLVAAVYWTRVARIWPLPQAGPPPWRTYAATVALTVALSSAPMLLSLRADVLSLKSPESCLGFVALTLHWVVLASALSAGAALLAQTAPRLSTFWLVVSALAAVLTLTNLMSERGLLMVVWSCLLLAAGVQWQLRLGHWLDNAMRRAPSVILVALAPVAAYRATQWLVGDGSDPLSGVYAHVVAQVLALGVLVAPAVRGLHAGRDHQS